MEALEPSVPPAERETRIRAAVTAGKQVVLYSPVATQNGPDARLIPGSHAFVIDRIVGNDIYYRNPHNYGVAQNDIRLVTFAQLATYFPSQHILPLGTDTMTEPIRSEPGPASIRLAGLAMFVLLLPMARADPPAEIVFSSGAQRTYDQGYPTRFDVFVSTVIDDKDWRKQRARGVETSVVVVENESRVLDYTVAFPELRNGDLFPVMGRMYRVISLAADGPGGGKRGHQMTAILVASKDVPKGITLGARTIVVPYTPGELGVTGFHGGTVRSVGLDLPAKGKAPARINVRVQNREEPSEVVRAATVSVGEVVLIGDKGFKVLSLTPPGRPQGIGADDWARLIGWIELDPKGIPEKELVAKKIPFVRPEKVAIQK